MATTDDGRPEAPPKSLLRLPSLTGMRWIAAFLVFVFHLGYVGGPTGAALHTVLGRAGHLGVSFFFILSGFVLTYSLRPTDTAPKFWRRRITKIFPNHWVTFLIAAVVLVVTGQGLALGDALPNLFLVHTWIPRLDSWIAMNSVSWSLSCELLFYLLFPFIVKLVKRVPEKLLWPTAGVTAVLLFLSPLLVQWLAPSTPKIPYDTFGPISYEQYWLVYFFPPLRLPEFILGIIMARIVLTNRWIRFGMVPAALLVVAGQAFALTAPSYSYLLSASAAPTLPVALLIAAGASADRTATYSPFRSRTMVWLGEISFAFYMVHKLVIAYVQDYVFSDGQEMFGTPWPLSKWLMFSALTFTVALAAAALLYRFVEIPFLRRFSTSRKDRGIEQRNSASGRPLESAGEQ